VACSLPFEENMERICQHCGESIVGNAYRVISQEKGITLLNMIVCALCFMEAKRLRLHTEEISLRGKQEFPRNRRSHTSRLEI
jgi:superfamily II helicase